MHLRTEYVTMNINYVLTIGLGLVACK